MTALIARHVVSALVVDKPGTLNRVASLLRARSFNIESLTVGSTHEPGRSRMTIVIHGDDAHTRQVLAQLNRLIEVIDVVDLTDASRFELELALVECSVPVNAAARSAIKRAMAAAGGELLTAGPEGWRLRLAAAPAQIETALAVLRGHGLRNLVRAGSVAMAANTPTQSGEKP